jgi:hypothetical protein
LEGIWERALFSAPALNAGPIELSDEFILMCNVILKFREESLRRTDFHGSIVPKPGVARNRLAEFHRRAHFAFRCPGNRQEKYFRRAASFRI